MAELSTSSVSGGAGSRRASLLSSEFMHKLERLDVMSQKILAGKMQGERRSKKRGQSVEFADYRNYVPGDDLRRIDWNLYARLDKLFLRLFVEEEDLSVAILLDVSRSMDYGDPNKLTYGRQLLAALGYVALVNFNRVHLFGYSDGLGAQMTRLRGRRPVPRMLEFAQQLTAADGGDFAAAMKEFALLHREKGVVIVISDFLDKGDPGEALRYLAGSRYDVYLLQLLSPQEVDPEKGGVSGDLRLTDVEDGNTAEVSVGPALIRRYKANLQAYCQHIRQQCLRREMSYLMSETSVPFDTLILQYLRRRGLLG